ncbi:hypothetical protein [Burkholderia pseudomallei]|uniref:hypothetical protein n=1 Tax=Burkholderia pseudomallei TaxID=28450 RepID=UPI000ACF7D5C|nr:hypothetical protein [Burkholderia pseudomallei]
MNPYLTGRRCALASVDGRLTLDCMKRTGGLPGKKRDCSSESDHARRCAPACPISSGITHEGERDFETIH